MAAKKRRKKASKTGKAWHKAMMAAKAAKHGGNTSSGVPKRPKRGKKTSTRIVTGANKASLSSELGLLQKIDKKVTRIDHTVNAGRYLAIKAKKHARHHDISRAFEEAERSGELAE